MEGADTASPDTMQGAVQIPRRQQPATNFASLPQDVLILVLKQSPDADTLLSSVVSCRAFFEAFQSSPNSIIKALVSRDIDSTILPDALILLLARKARPIPRWELEPAVVQILSRRNDAALVTDHRWTLADGVGILRLHSIIDDLAKQCATFRLSWLKKLTFQEQEPPSDNELNRIKRALYRFEINRTLIPVRHGSDRYVLGAQFAFLEEACPWENEQLASVHGYLWRCVAPAFNEVVDHDIAWGNFETQRAFSSSSEHTEAVMARGLRVIYDVSRAKTYEERYELISSGAEEPASVVFLAKIFRVYDDTLQGRTQQHLIRGGTIKARPNVVTHGDTEKGPEKFWRWFRQVYSEGQLAWRTTADYYDRWERNSGGVFWDEKRWDSTGTFRRPVAGVRAEYGSRTPYYEPVGGYVYYGTYTAQKRSWEARSALYEEGVRGYWEWPKVQKKSAKAVKGKSGEKRPRKKRRTQG